MNTIETARTLLAKESPEIRRAVGELVSRAMQATSFKYAAEIDYWQFARELIEDKAVNMVPARRELGSILDSDTDEMPVEEILKTVGKPPTFEQIKQTVEGIRKQHLTDCDWLDDERSIYGDFIIKGISGEFYPCKPDIFAKTYEKAKP